MLVYDDLLCEFLDDGKEENVQVETHSYEPKKEDTKDLQQVQNQLVNINKTIVNFENQLKQLKQVKERLNAELLKGMQEHDIWKIILGDTTITRTKASERCSIDTKKLKEEMPDIAKMYEKITPIEESIRIKIGGTDNEI